MRIWKPPMFARNKVYPHYIPVITQDTLSLWVTYLKLNLLHRKAFNFCAVSWISLFLFHNTTPPNTIRINAIYSNRGKYVLPNAVHRFTKGFLWYVFFLFIVTTARVGPLPPQNFTSRYPALPRLPHSLIFSSKKEAFWILSSRPNLMVTSLS
jgi:hypothetical protein